MQTKGKKKIIDNAGALQEKYAWKSEKQKKKPAAVCPYAKKCGGCDYQGMSYEQQLQEKQTYVRKNIGDYCKVLPIIGMENPYHYRNKVHAVFDVERRGKHANGGRRTAGNGHAKAAPGGVISGVYKAGTHEVINIDLKNGDICANLATVEGRQAAIDGLYERCPKGLDGIVCNAGVSGSCGNYELVISLNYFGTVKLARGVYELLKKKHGSVVVTVSNTISQGTGRMDIVDLLNNVGDEQRIRSIVSTLDTANQTVGQSMYMATKYALARWVRRISASWAANGVRVNAVAPGNVRTAMTDSLSDAAKYAVSALPIPVRYGSDALMDPSEIAESMKFLLSDAARGVNGIILFTDGGTDALLNSEKVY